MNNEFGKVTSELGAAYERWKTNEKEKNKAKDKFFALASEHLAEEVPAQSSVNISAENEDQARRIVERRFRFQKVIDVWEIEKGQWGITLEEDPELRSFSYINKEDGKVYSRQVVQASPMLDDEALQEEDPDLWEIITEEVTTRRIRDMETLTDEQLARVQPYIFSPRPTVKLGAPRKAKPEELDESDND